MVHAVEVRLGEFFAKLSPYDMVRVLNLRSALLEILWMHSVPTPHTLRQMRKRLLELLARIHLRSLGLGLCNPLLLRLLLCPLLCKFCRALGFADPLEKLRLGSVLNRIAL